MIWKVTILQSFVAVVNVVALLRMLTLSLEANCLDNLAPKILPQLLPLQYALQIRLRITDFPHNEHGEHKLPSQTITI